MKRAAFVAIVGQFGKPRGLIGYLAGWLMALRPSNRQRNRWVVSLLDVQPGERVLEIGFGPGIALAELSRRGGDSGQISGLDHSAVMLRQAARRNRAGIETGRVTLTLGRVEHLPPALDGPFDAIMAVNSLGFWTAPAERLGDLRRRLTPGGRIAIASQPRCPGATKKTALEAANGIAELLEEAGFTQLRTAILDLSPPVVCVIAINQDPAAVSMSGEACEGDSRAQPPAVEAIAAGFITPEAVSAAFRRSGVELGID